MLSVTAPSYAKPSSYELSTLPRPSISEPTEVLIEVHAGSINPIDVKKASGALKLAVKETFPYQIGYDCAGVVREVGKGVKRLKVGDEVYTRLPERYRGSWSEYAVCDEQYLALKPKSLSFGDAAAVPLAAMTALQAFKRYRGSLEGKTVFVPAGLSGTGSYAIQLAKNVFRVGKVITTVSTAKVPRVPELLGEGVVDQIIDYTKESPQSAIPRRSVDFILDTTGESLSFLSLMVPSTSTIVSITSTPSGKQFQEADFLRRPDRPYVPWWAWGFLSGMDAFRRGRAWRWGVEYSFLFEDVNLEDMDALSRYAEEGKLKSIVGSTVPLKDLEKVRQACGQVYEGKGGIGKSVILMR